MSEKRFGWDCPYKDNRDFCTALLKPRICCPSICLFGLSDNIDEQQSTRMCVWFEDLLNEAYEDDGENAKLRIENKKLQEENEQLQEIVNKLEEVIDV